MFDIKRLDSVKSAKAVLRALAIALAINALIMLLIGQHESGIVIGGGAVALTVPTFIV